MLKKISRLLNFVFHFENSIVFQKNLKIISSMMFIILAREKHFGRTENCYIAVLFKTICCSIWKIDFWQLHWEMQGYIACRSSNSFKLVEIQQPIAILIFYQPNKNSLRLQRPRCLHHLAITKIAVCRVSDALISI